MPEEVMNGLPGAARMMGMLLTCDPVADPASDDLFSLIENMDTDALAEEWPCVEAAEAAQVLALLRAGAAEDRSELASKYRRLLVGPNKLAAPPYGSVYTDHDQVVFGESTLALRAWMRKEGVGAEGLDGAPEDHIGTMLLLLSWLCENKPELVEEYLAKHLLTWASHYLEQLQEAAGDGLYAAVARLTRQTLIGIEKELELEVEPVRFYR